MPDLHNIDHVESFRQIQYPAINQADISKLENGTRNPSLKLLKRLADGMGMDLKLVFTPKEPQNLKLAK